MGYASPKKVEARKIQNRRTSDFFSEALGSFDDYDNYSLTEED
jgi:hypothetical protein